jgi:hypothetical protein
MSAKFDRLMNLDYDVRCTHAQIAFGQNIPESLLNSRREKFYAALDALTPDELVAFREYRRSLREVTA